MSPSTVVLRKSGKAPWSQEKKDAMLAWSLGIALVMAVAAGWSYLEFGHFWGMLGVVPLGLGVPALVELTRS